MKKAALAAVLLAVMMTMTSCLTILGSLLDDKTRQADTDDPYPSVTTKTVSEITETAPASDPDIDRAPETTQAVTAANETSAPDESEIRQSVKDAIDSYEAFVDEYCEFMATYDPADFSQLSKYLDLLQTEIDMTNNFTKLESDLTDAEIIYYTEVSLRCSKKLLDAASSFFKK